MEEISTNIQLATLIALKGNRKLNFLSPCIGNLNKNIVDYKFSHFSLFLFTYIFDITVGLLKSQWFDVVLANK